MLESFLTIATHPLLWIFIGLTVVFFGVQGLVGQSAEAPTAPDDRIRRLAEKVGMKGLHPVLFLLVSLIFLVLCAMWAFLGVTLFLGLCTILFEVISHDASEAVENVWEWRFTLAQLVALTTVLGAVIALPITINRLILTRRQTDTVEQGHITDRINKAVEGLGAEKTVDRIGRPITIWTGKPETVTHQVEDPDKFTLPPRAIETRRYRDISPLGHPDNEQYHEGLHVDVKAWPDEKTMIEWQGTNTSVSENEHLGKVGDWQVFTETEPNLEVRIGAIYALERISQDSARDHIQIMEILCAYIRENAKIADPLAEDLLDTKQERVRLRSDIDAAIKVIGRRPLELIQEARAFFSKGVYRKRFDLRGVDLCGAELQDLAFHDIEFNGSSFQRANLMNTVFDNVTFNGSDFTGAITARAQAVKDCVFSYCLFSGLDSLYIILPLTRDRVLWCAVRDTIFSDADLRDLLQEKQSMLEIWFGDQSVELPSSLLSDFEGQRPSHWPQSVMDIKTFVQEWRRWQNEGPDYKLPEEG